MQNAGQAGRRSFGLLAIVRARLVVADESEVVIPFVDIRFRLWSIPAPPSWRLRHLRRRWHAIVLHKSCLRRWFLLDRSLPTSRLIASWIILRRSRSLLPSWRSLLLVREFSEFVDFIELIDRRLWSSSLRTLSLRLLAPIIAWTFSSIVAWTLTSLPWLGPEIDIIEVRLASTSRRGSGIVVCGTGESPEDLIENDRAEGAESNAIQAEVAHMQREIGGTNQQRD